MEGEGERSDRVGVLKERRGKREGRREREGGKEERG